MTTSINTACGGILSGRKSEADIRGGGVRRGGAFYDRLASVARVVEQAWGEVAADARVRAVSVAPSGLQYIGDRDRGFAPAANNLRPFGAGRAAGVSSGRKT